MNLNSISLTLHVLSAVVWVGGMFFAYLCLRPAAATVLEPPQRLTLWAATFSRFFPWVWLSVLFLLLTGYVMIFSLWSGLQYAPLSVNIMQGLGILMMLIYMHVFFAPYRRLRQAVANQDWPTGAKYLNQIRILVAINLSLGLLVITIAAGGRYL